MVSNKKKMNKIKNIASLGCLDFYLLFVASKEKKKKGNKSLTGTIKITKTTIK